MKQIHDWCSNERTSTSDGDDVTCDAVHEQICEHCVACLFPQIKDAIKFGGTLSNKGWADFAKATWYDPVDGRRIGKKAIKKLVAQIRANM